MIDEFDGDGDGESKHFILIYALCLPGCECGGGELQKKKPVTSYLLMVLKKHMLTDPIVFKIIIYQNQKN